jgi:lipoprotein-releasing system ATP-binding protein
MAVPALEAKHISKSFQDHIESRVLNDVSFKVEKGEFVSVMGKSGCGKSTLLYILSTMDTSYEGSLLIDGELMTGQSAHRLAEVRNEKIGFVFQFHYLLNEFSVVKNVMLPGLKLNKYTEKEIEANAMKWLNVLGIDRHAQKRPNLLSGGEKQRVAIARALINNPLIIMGDEPTGNLDKKNSQVVLDIFKDLSQQFGQTLLIVTHDPEFATHTDRSIEMEDGRIISPS